MCQAPPAISRIQQLEKQLFSFSFRFCKHCQWIVPLLLIARFFFALEVLWCLSCTSPSVSIRFLIVSRHFEHRGSFFLCSVFISCFVLTFAAFCNSACVQGVALFYGGLVKRSSTITIMSAQLSLSFPPLFLMFSHVSSSFTKVFPRFFSVPCLFPLLSVLTL